MVGHYETVIDEFYDRSETGFRRRSSPRPPRSRAPRNRSRTSTARRRSCFRLRVWSPASSFFAFEGEPARRPGLRRRARHGASFPRDRAEGRSRDAAAGHRARRRAGWRGGPVLDLDGLFQQPARTRARFDPRSGRHPRTSQFALGSDWLDGGPCFPGRRRCGASSTTSTN